MPSSIGIKGKARYGKYFAIQTYNPSDVVIWNRQHRMTFFDRWKGVMALDTIEYYKFLYPEVYYHYSEPTSDGTTQISPYVVVNGALQGIYMLWIDGKLYYTNLAQQLDVYTFQVTPGMHSIKIRTYNREVFVRNFFVKKGEKNIVSFNAEKDYVKMESENNSMENLMLTSKLLDKKEHGMFSEKEMNYLSSQLIMIDNNFGYLELPGNEKLIELPAYIHSGNAVYYLNHTKRSSYNHTLRMNTNTPILAGPFPNRNYMNGMSNIASVYAGNQLITNFELEGGNKYTLFDNYQKAKSWDKTPFNKKLSRHTPSTDFKQELVTPERIDEQLEKLLKTNLSTLSGLVSGTFQTDASGNIFRLNLSFKRDKEYKETMKPVLIFIHPGEKDSLADYRLYYGGTRNFKNLSQEHITIHLIFNDSTSYSKSIKLRPGGQNYLEIDSIYYEIDNGIAKNALDLFAQNVKKSFTENPYINRDSTGVAKGSFSRTLVTHDVVGGDYSTYNQDNRRKGIITGTVFDADGPIPGVNVMIEGTAFGTATDFDGRFELKVKEGDVIVVAFTGMITKRIKCEEGRDYKIKLKEDSQELEEVVVVGYGVVKKSDLTGSLSSLTTNSVIDQALHGRIAGVMIRGTSSKEKSEQPLILVNGLPFNGDLKDIDVRSIVSINELKDASAAAVYGASAANGVIMIQTNALPANQSDSGAEMPEANNMRRNFHDDAFWQPKLTTNKKGEASFEVTYPDDITSWNAYFIAIGNKKQVDKKQMSIKSFKALSTRLSMPHFAVRGDSLNAIGRIANHLGDSIQVERKIEIDGHVKKDEIKAGTSHVDYIPVKAEKDDSLAIAYSLQMPNGYFDGEERSIPIIEQGMLQTHGDFKVINDSRSHTLEVNPSLGEATIYAESSSFELFLREIDKVDKYPYYCNEQMASKIKVLLAKKRIFEIFGKEFKEDKKINNLISRLNKNKNTEGLWGWWNNDKTEFWISKQIISAMLDAEKAGYKTHFDKDKWMIAFERELKNGLSDLRLTDKKQAFFAKRELLNRLIYLKQIDAPVDYQAYFKEIDSQLKSNTITDKLKTMYVMSLIGLQDGINTDSLMQYAQKTMLGSIYWGDKTEGNHLSRAFILPYENNVENTLIAYTILKNKGNHNEELEKIRNYFFECRHNGFWQNTYESSRIIETIMPDMLKKDDSFSETTMYVNGKAITKFPYTGKIGTSTPVEVRKEGTLPSFVTVYQQAWNSAPKPESTKGFTIKSYFAVNNDTISHLTAGKVAQLEVLVNIDADADYVQIEVPIPAGCSYETKERDYSRNEAHREHFKEKVVVFSNKLKKGEHKFSINLIPRYTGTYHLNPAKAELMYFPTFYGNEMVKEVVVR